MGFRVRVARTRDKQYPLSSLNPFHCPDGMLNRILHISCNFAVFLILLSSKVEGRPQFCFHLRRTSLLAKICLLNINLLPWATLSALPYYVMCAKCVACGLFDLGLSYHLYNTIAILQRSNQDPES